MDIKTTTGMYNKIIRGKIVGGSVCGYMWGKCIFKVTEYTYNNIENF